MYRIGQSSDIHRLKEGEALILGGVNIKHDKGCLGHSDADALLHAVAESILGALALGDLGSHFPDNDPQYAGISSMLILKSVAKLMSEAGYAINNLDALILIEKPKMAPHIDAMRKNIAACLNCDVSQISVKATRGEGMGYIGREEGVMAQCVTLLKKK